MEIKEVASSPYLYATVASLAILIIGALAYQKIGLLSNCAPVTGIIMMSVGAGILFFEGIIFGCQRREIQFFPPNGSEKNWTMRLPGESRCLSFVRMQKKDTLTQPNHFYIWSQNAPRGENINLWISVNIEKKHLMFLVGEVVKDTLVPNEYQKKQQQGFLNLMRTHKDTLKYQSHT